MNHKRRRPKSRRRKPWKSNHTKGQAESETMQERKAREDERQQRGEARAV